MCFSYWVWRNVYPSVATCTHGCGCACVQVSVCVCVCVCVYVCVRSCDCVKCVLSCKEDVSQDWQSGMNDNNILTHKHIPAHTHTHTPTHIHVHTPSSYYHPYPQLSKQVSGLLKLPSREALRAHTHKTQPALLWIFWTKQYTHTQTSKAIHVPSNSECT